MPQVPQLSLPTVAPNGTPVPLQRDTKPSLAFGSTVLAGGLADASTNTKEITDALEEHALQMKQIETQTTASAAANDYTSAANAISGDYELNTLGTNATQDSMESAYQKLEDKRQEIGADLSPAARRAYDVSSRGSLGYAQTVVRNHTATEFRKSAVGTSDASIQIAKDQWAASDDPAVQAASTAQIGKELAFQQQTLGLSDAQASDKLRNTVGSVYLNKVGDAVNNGDYPGGLDILAANKDSMTEEQIRAAQTLLKVGHTAYTANSEVAAQRAYYETGTPHASTASAAPSGSWDKGVAAIKADPTTALSSLAGGPVVVTSGARTSDHNAAVGGAPNSEHLTGNAWDFVPQQGKDLTATAKTVAAGLHAQGVPFDQIEVDPSNGHVHVGFGPKNRNEIIDAKGGVIQQGGTVPGNAVPDLPVPTPTSDPHQFLADSEEAIEKYAYAKYANPTQAASVAASMKAEAGRQASIIQGRQEAAWDRLDTAAQDNHIQDPATLSTSYPGAAADLALISATPHYSKGLKSTISSNANELTQARIDEETGLIGTIKTDPAKFAATNLADLDLTRAQRLTYTKQQADVRDKLSKGINTDNLVKQTLNSVEGQAAIGANGLNLTKGSPEYAQFAGTLSYLIDANSPDGKAPTGKVLNDLVAQASAQVAQKGFHFTTPREYQVPDKYKQQALAAGRAKGREYTDADIAYMYQMQVHRNGQ